MVKKRVGEPWMPADQYGRGLPRFTVNLLVTDLARSIEFYRRSGAEMLDEWRGCRLTGEALQAAARE